MIGSIDAHCVAQPTPLFRFFASFYFPSSPNGVGKTSLHSFGSQLFLFLVFTTRSDAVISLDRKCGFVLSQTFVLCLVRLMAVISSKLTWHSDPTSNSSFRGLVFIVCWLPWYDIFISISYFRLWKWWWALCLCSWSAGFPTTPTSSLPTSTQQSTTATTFRSDCQLYYCHFNADSIIGINQKPKGDLPEHLLAGHVKLDVQSYDLLLHEPEVIFYMMMVVNFGKWRPPK